MIDRSIDPSADAEVRALIQQRRKIDAIKLLRERTGVGLKDGKDIVDATEREMGLPVSAPASGGGLLVAMVVIISLVIAWWWLRA